MDGKAVPFLQGEERGATAAETAVRDCEGELRREKPRMRGCVSLRGRACACAVLPQGGVRRPGQSGETVLVEPSLGSLRTTGLGSGY